MRTSSMLLRSSTSSVILLMAALQQLLLQASEVDHRGVHLHLCRLQRSGDVIKRKDDELLDQREQLTRLRDDFDELRGQYAALTAQGHGREQQRELSVSDQQHPLCQQCSSGGTSVACTRCIRAAGTTPTSSRRCKAVANVHVSGVLG